MIPQFLTGSPGLVDDGNRYWVDTDAPGFEQEMAAFYEDFMQVEEDPGLVSFGSSSFGGVSREMVSDAVAEVIASINTTGGLAGVYICANGDWGPDLSSAADIISFDAYFYFANFILYKDQLVSFLNRDGILAWGIVPTGDPLVVAKESVTSLFTKWQKQLALLTTFGFSEKQLMSQTLIAPSCGTGSLTRELAQKVLVMTAELAQ